MGDVAKILKTIKISMSADNDLTFVVVIIFISSGLKADF